MNHCLHTEARFGLELSTAELFVIPTIRVYTGRDWIISAEWLCFSAWVGSAR